MKPAGCHAWWLWGGRYGLMAAVLWLAWLPQTAVSAEVVSQPHVQVALVSKQTSAQPGAVVDVGVWMRLDEHWHVYWRNPGDSGLATKVTWELPAGYEAGPIRWPHPQRFETGPLMTFGYADEVLLPVRIKVPADAEPGTSAKLTAKVDWLVCKEACLPGSATLELVLPVAAEATEVDAKWREAFESAEAALPRSDPGWQVTATTDGEGVTLHVAGPASRRQATPQIFFFPDEAGVIAPGAVQTLTVAADRLTLELQPATERTEPIEQLRGVLVAEDGWDIDARFKALRVDVAVGSGLGSTTAGPPAEVASTGGLSLMLMLGSALLGGVILNVMPCVFPILSIKILGFVSQAGGDRVVIRRHGYMFGLGVLVSFWALAGLLVALRAGGAQLGWGFQLQSPGFVAALALLLFAVGLNLMGVFEVGGNVIGLAAKLGGDTTGSGRGGYVGSFLSGVLATALATPCTAPFMGPAVGYALTLQAWTAMLVFTFLGIGMAGPYVLLSLAPQLLERLPRPGPWMESFKQFMAFPLFAATAWLAWVFSLQTDTEGLLVLLLALVLLAIGAWVLGRWAAPARRPNVRRVAKVAAGVAAACAVWVSLEAARGTDDGLEWETYSAERIEQLRAEGRPVFVDFTAAWCVTCKWNEFGALSSAAVTAKFREKNVALLKADWTDRGPTIAEALAAFGRSTVPLYVMYSPDEAIPPQVLPTVLTAQTVVRAVEEASTGARATTVARDDVQLTD